MSIEEGSKAPNFCLRDKDGIEHSSKDIKHPVRIIYFYPKDSTPGCTLEAQEFTRERKAFEKAKAIVIGISGGDEKSKTKFCKKSGVEILLLSDPEFEVAKAYEAYGPKVFMGRKFKGILRRTFVINKAGKILKIFDKVKPEGHANEVLAYLRTISKTR